MSSVSTTALGLEGPLCKWTNVVKGWQYRWFVLDQTTGLLSYYTSKDKMKRGSRRGCVRLKGAVIGIDGEDDATFTITVDQKTFHFQCQNGEERAKWIEYLEDTILRHKGKPSEARKASSERNVDKKVLEADAYLQILIDQVKALERKMDGVEDENIREKLNSMRNNAKAVIESVKQGIVMLQIAKYAICPDHLKLVPFRSFVQNTVSPVNGILSRDEREDSSSPVDVPSSSKGPPHSHMSSNSSLDSIEEIPSPKRSLPLKSEGMPARSYSSSEDEWEDAVESLGSRDGKKVAEITRVESIYADDSEEEALDCEKHGSVITHLLSQVRLGMDLTRVVLPTFILEKRSLLEMYADFFAHPELFSTISDLSDARDRMLQVIKWYLSSFHAGRKGSIAKKPYNPLLGEEFYCLWDIEPDEDQKNQNELVTDGPVPWATPHQVVFLAEQVSHHPPISAFYAECADKLMEFNAHIWTKSKFLGLSIAAEMIGKACVSDLKHEEEYIASFPSAYGRSILTVPWFEMGGKCNIACAKTGYSANVTFHTKPFYGGKLHRITAEVLHVTDKKPFLTIEGEWNGVMTGKWADGVSNPPEKTEVFIDTTKMSINKKKVKPLDQQREYESRRLWNGVTVNLKSKNIEKATDCKHFLEERQRREARERKESGVKYQTKFFQEDGECWVYQKPLQKRLEDRAQQLLSRQTDQSDSTSSPNQSNNSSSSPSSSPERSQSASNDLNGQPLIQLETTQNAASLLD
ncbi:Oxysterol-binding protein-related protein 9 [Holothuria leucospilota]|uniref:Oxysterol-binding protein n=1 Tax=Holothuria leucospilota TaxID=206669 RepID=A0A9Q1HCB2_HOLLE|nr:Oxysterol-binding protein-related protein 9 [Holothuria leucospilota]